MKAFIFSGRFQPLHLGHIAFIKKIKEKHPCDLLLICIIRNSIINNIPPKVESEFHRENISKQTHYNNPLPNWNRYMLMSIAIENDPLLRKNTEIIFRDRSDINWEASLVDLPDDRIWIFPRQTRDNFDAEKVRYYYDQNEKIEFIDCPIDTFFVSGTKIRNSLLDGDKSFDFLPSCCRRYFEQECLQYFLNNTKK